MDEPTTPDHGTDEVVAQLRRYADAAEPTIPRGLTAQHHPRRPRWRPLAAAAVVLALVAGGTFAVLSRDDRTVTLEGTVPAPLPDPAPDLDDACPAPRADGPRVDDLRVMLPSVTTTTADTTTDDRGEVESILLAVGDDGTEIRVTEVGADQLAEAFPVDPTDDPAATFEICDPFTAEPQRSPVGGYWALGQDERLSAELGLADGGARGWLVTVSTPLDGREHPRSERTGTARAELRRLIAGMSWPAPVDVPRGNDVCANEPLTTVGDHDLLAVPQGYTLGETQEMETGAVDAGGEQWTRLGLLGPDGAQITVVSISTSNFEEALANNAVGIEPGSLTIERCHLSGGLTAPVEELTEIRRSQNRIVIGAQEWEYGGWLVVGSNGATEDDVIATAEALRS